MMNESRITRNKEPIYQDDELELLRLGLDHDLYPNVDAITEIATSFVPWIAACFGSEPRSIWVVTFSKTTIRCV